MAILSFEIPSTPYKLGEWDCYQLAKWVHCQLFPGSTVFPEIKYPVPLNEKTASEYLIKKIKEDCTKTTNPKTGDIVELNYYGKHSLGTWITTKNDERKIIVMSSRGLLTPLSMMEDKIVGLWRLNGLKEKSH